MPRFFFDCACDDAFHPDDHGSDLEREDVADLAREIAADLLRDGVSGAGPSAILVLVRAEDGSSVYTAQVCLNSFVAESAP